MVETLINTLPDAMVDHIESFMPVEPDWEYVYGQTTIYWTEHYITFGGGPEGGYVFFFREREAGWYRWLRQWGEEPKYSKVDGLLAQKFDGPSEYVAVVPYDFETEDEDITVLDTHMMIEHHMTK